MKRIIEYLLIGFVFVIASSGCLNAKKDSNLTEKEALIIAIKAFPEKTYGNVSDYNVSVSDRKYDGRWYVSFYKIRDANVGDDFAVEVDAATRSFKIIPGE